MGRGTKQLIDFLLEEEEKKPTPREKYQEIEKISKTNEKTKKAFDLLKSFPHKRMLEIISPVHNAIIKGTTRGKEEEYRIDSVIDMMQKIKNSPNVDFTRSAHVFGKTSVGFSGVYTEDIRGIKKIREQIRKAIREVEKTRKELEDAKKTMLDSYEKIMSGSDKEIEGINIREIRIKVRELEQKTERTEGGRRELQQALVAFEELFQKKHGGAYGLQKSREDEVVQSKEKKIEAEAAAPGERRKETEQVHKDKVAKEKRSKQIKGLRLRRLPIPTLLKTARDVATMQLPNTEVFDEVINKQRIGIKADDMYDDMIRNQTQEETTKFVYKEVMVEFINLIRIIVENYSDPSKVMDIQRAINTVAYIEEGFEERFLKHIDGYKKGYLLQRLRSEWGRKGAFVRDEQGRKKRIILKKRDPNDPLPPQSRRPTPNPDKGLGSSNVGGKLPRKLVGGPNRPKRKVVRIKPKIAWKPKQTKKDDKEE